MNILTTDYNTLTLILTFIPMVATAVFSALCFHRMMFGTIGKLMVGGLAILVVSLACGLMFNATREPFWQAIAGTTRLIGWTGLAMAFMSWFIEIDRSLP